MPQSHPLAEDRLILAVTGEGGLRSDETCVLALLRRLEQPGAARGALDEHCDQFILKGRGRAMRSAMLCCHRVRGSCTGT